MFSLDNSELPQFVEEGRKIRLVPTASAQDSEPISVLPLRFHWPCHRPAEQRDKLATSHSITSSARASSVAGTSRPSARAVLRLITSSYLVGACTGKSPGFSPLRMR